jgi:hypothetical protein
MLDGVTVSWAVGAGAVGGGAVSAGGSGFCFFLQPASPIRATASKTGTKKRKICFKMVSFCGYGKTSVSVTLCDDLQGCLNGNRKGTDSG